MIFYVETLFIILN